MVHVASVTESGKCISTFADAQLVMGATGMLYYDCNGGGAQGHFDVSGTNGLEILGTFDAASNHLELCSPTIGIPEGSCTMLVVHSFQGTVTEGKFEYTYTQRFATSDCGDGCSATAVVTR
jgi:hypothetical protein